MALMTQSDCDKIIEFEATQIFEDDGTTHKQWNYRFVNENGVHCNHVDTETAGDVDTSTLRGVAETLIKANCEMEAAPIKTQGTPINIM